MKRFLALFLAICLCFGCVPATHAHATEVEGDPQAENSWRFEDGQLVDAAEFMDIIEDSEEAPTVDTFYPSENKYLGIDVSEHQGSINWDKVKAAGIKYAIIRAGYGQDQAGLDDDYFTYNISECNRVGIPFGLYFYSYAQSVDRAKGEADHAIRLIKVAKQYNNFKLPMYYDLEENSQYAMGAAAVYNMAVAFHDRVEAATSVAVGIYANTNWFTNILTYSWYQSQPLWVAQYNSYCQYNGDYDIWQYSSSGSVNGISGRVDMNYMRVELSSFTNNVTGGITGGTAASATLITNKDTYAVGEAIMVTAGTSSSSAWVGLYNEAGNLSKSLWWYQITNSDGSKTGDYGKPVNLLDKICNWNESYMNWEKGDFWGSLKPGKYKLSVYVGESAPYQEIASKIITVSGSVSSASLSIDKTSYTNLDGATESAIITASHPNADAWVGIFKKGVSTYEKTCVCFYNVYNCNNEPKDIFWDHDTTDSVSWRGNWPLDTGDYEVVLFKDGGYTKVASKDFKVVEPSVTTDADTYCVNKPINVSTTYNAENAWIGLYKSNTTPGYENPSMYWYYISKAGMSNVNIKAQVEGDSGSFGAGSYKVVLFQDNGYTSLATKNITIKACTDGNKDHKCDYCGATVSSCNSNGQSNVLASAATCTSAATYYKKCSICGKQSTATYTSGNKNTNNHASGCELTWTTKNQTHHEQKYSKCGTSKVAYATHTWKNGTCSVCSYTCTHTGGTATCTAKPVCTNCGVSYGSVNATNHTGTASWTTKDANQHESKYSCCDATAVTLENHEWADGVCAECGYTCEHVDKNEKDHICDTCSKVLGACKDEDNNNKCDYCGATMCEHEGGEADCQTSAICSKCGKPYGSTDPSNHTGAPEWTKTNDTHKQAYSCCGAVTVEEDSHVDEDEADHKCDICDKALGECSDKTGDGDHKCDVCGKDNITDCADKADDKDHKCDECGKDNMNECVDTDPADHKCDICDKVLGQCKDENNDNKCDHCGETMCEHKDENKDHNCDTCGKPVSDHKDENKDHNCDTCGKPVSDHKDENKDHNCDTCGKPVSDHKDENNDNKCDHCGDTMCEHKDENKDHNCDLCEKPLSDCQDENKDHKCDTCDKTLSECKDEDKDYKCDICDKDLDKPAPEVGSDRLAGEDRFDTAFIVANKMKEELGVEKFNTIIVASGKDFADALSGSYLAAVKNAPILLSYKDKQNQQVMEYIRLNLAKGGIVYILGGTKAVPESMEKALSDLNVKRLAGENRFDTNTEILKEVGVPADETVLVCTGTDFADCLSGSAVGKPIMLVYKRLMDSQKKFLPTLDNDFCIIGGENAVNKNIETTLQKYGEVERLAGAHRYETSVLVAEKFFQDPDSAVLAYAKNYPDGLCGGALAVTKGAPLLLTDSKYFSFAAEYAEKNGISFGVVLGGKKLISDKAVEAIFGE